MRIAARSGSATDKLSSGASPSRITQERREARFWECRHSLRLWPIPNGTKESLANFLTGRLGFDCSFVDDIGHVSVRLHRDPRSKLTDEAIVEFETKEVCEAQAPNLTKHRDAAGMRLHIPCKKSSELS